ncbi:hypothetical protein [Streptomyces sp. DG2A-72]|uniref:hypothetical protein n=1 Tax=Streptomyces sp. DG2A-72 TaxID=3051386 RepID=UPI003463A2D5
MDVATAITDSCSAVMPADSIAARAAAVARSEVACPTAAQRRWRIAVLRVIQASSTPAGAPTSSLETTLGGT